jgi:hypothetical protein
MLLLPFLPIMAQLTEGLELTENERVAITSMRLDVIGNNRWSDDPSLEAKGA